MKVRQVLTTMAACAILLGLCACGAANTNTSAVPASDTPLPQTTSIPDSITYTGSGNNVVTLSPFDGSYVFRISGNTAGRHFSVKGYNPNSEVTDLFVNTTKPYSGVTIDPSQSTVSLEISATGDWVVEVVSLYAMPSISQGETFSGNGDAILQVTGNSNTVTISGNKQAAYFSVKAYGNFLPDLLVSTTEPYTGTVMLKGIVAFLKINAEGEWCVTLPSNETISPTENDNQTDSRGITGMGAEKALLALVSYGLPYQLNDSQAEQQDYCAYTCGSSGSNGGITYDYSVSLDLDKEIVGATFAISSATVSADKLRSEANTYFFVIGSALNSGNNTNKEAFVEWLDKSLPDVSKTADSITLGDATFELYALDGMYWLDISKAK